MEMKRISVKISLSLREFQLIRVISRDRSVKWKRAEGCLDIQTRGGKGLDLLQAVITRKWGCGWTPRSAKGRDLRRRLRVPTSVGVATPATPNPTTRRLTVCVSF